MSKSSMKVLHVIPGISKSSGGPTQAIFPMCRSLREKGIDVLLVTTDAGLASFAIAKVENDETLPVKVFPSQLGSSFKYSRPLARWLHENVGKYDLVHIHAVFNHACIAAASACANKRVPYIIRPLGTLDPWGMSQKSYRKRLFWLLFGKRMLSHAAAIHYTAFGEQQATEESLGLNHGHVVPLGVEPHFCNRRIAGETFAKERGESSNNPYVLVLSRLLPTKGLDVLLASFLSLIKQKEFSKWKLVMAGAGPADYLRALKNKVSAEGAEESVTFPGWLEGDIKADMLSRASLLALPSYHENFGLCVMEALAAGVPVLVSPHVNLAAEIKSASAGWVAEIDQALIMAELTEIFASPEERTRRGEAGRILARHFSWEQIANQLVSKYSSILQAQTSNATSHQQK